MQRLLIHQLSLWRLPPILIISLKRFKAFRQTYVKVLFIIYLVI